MCVNSNNVTQLMVAGVARVYYVGAFPQERIASRVGIKCLVLAASVRESLIFKSTDNVTLVIALAARYLQENIADGDFAGLGWGILG